MSRINWTELLEHKGDELLTWLHELEELCKRAIRGVGLFITREIPRVLRLFVEWLEKHCIYALRVALRVTRILGLVACLALIVLGPVLIYPNPFTFGWLALSLTGAVWYVRLHLNKTIPSSSSRKEQSHARA